MVRNSSLTTLIKRVNYKVQLIKIKFHNAYGQCRFISLVILYNYDLLTNFPNMGENITFPMAFALKTNPTTDADNPLLEA